MKASAFLLFFCCVLFFSCDVSLSTTSAQDTTNDSSLAVIPDVSAIVAAGDFKLDIKNSAPGSTNSFTRESYSVSQPDSILFKNVPLKIALAALLDLDTADIKSNKPQSLIQRINLSFSGKQTGFTSRFIALDGLGKYYRFSVGTTQSPAWDLVIEDHSKLDRIVVDEANEQKVTTYESELIKGITLQKNKLSSLAEGLTNLWHEEIRDKTNDSRVFSMSFSVKSFQQLQTAISEYGLALKRSENGPPYWYIRFEE